MREALRNYKLWHTGGNCLMYGRSVGDRYTFGITDTSGNDLPDDDQHVVAGITDNEANGDQIAMLEDVPLDAALAWLEGIEAAQVWYEHNGAGYQWSLLKLLSLFAESRAFGGPSGAVLVGKLVEVLLRDGSVNGIHDGGRFLIHKWQQFRGSTTRAMAGDWLRRELGERT